MKSKSPSNSNSKGPRVDKPLIKFFILAYTIAWGVLGIFNILANQSGLETLDLLNMAENMNFGLYDPVLPGWVMYLISRLADFAFSIAGIIMIFSEEGKEGLRKLWKRLTNWNFHKGWYLLALLPVAIYFIAVILANINDANVFKSGVVNLSILGKLLFSIEGGLLVSLFLRGAMGEELGLRGFALPRLQKSMTPFKASLVIGALWGAWHIPVLIGRDVVSIIAFIILAFLLSFIFTLLFNESGGSLIPVLLFHATQNWEEGFETIFPGLINTDWELFSTILTLLAGIIVGIVLWKQGRK